MVTGFCILLKTAANKDSYLNKLIGPGGLTHGRFVAVRERFVRALAHERPCIVLQPTLDDLVLEFLQLLGELDVTQRDIFVADAEMANFLRYDSARNNVSNG